MFESVKKRVGNYLTVSDLTGIIKKRLLIPELQRIWVLGEITDLKSFTPGKHAYFSLKDQGSLINCAFFAGNNRFFKGKLENGMKVLVFGSIDVYPPRGNYTFIVRQIIPAGEGDFAIKLKKLEEKLKKEGLFDRKRPFPVLPETIGVITSKDGAAIKDFLKMAKDVPYLKIIIFHSLVQGEEAPASIIEGIEKLNKIDEVEVIVITRGGGSEEDLMCFYDESLVRAIYNSKKPVISAVGHERDVVFTDRVADLRLATPTDAGKFFAENYKKTFQNFKKLSYSLETSLKRWLAKNPEIVKLHSLSSRLLYLEDSLLNQKLMTIAQLKNDIVLSIDSNLKEKKTGLNSLYLKLHPDFLFSDYHSKKQKVNSIEHSLRRAIETTINEKKADLFKLTISLKQNGIKSAEHKIMWYKVVSAGFNAGLITNKLEREKGTFLNLLKIFKEKLTGSIREKEKEIKGISQRLNVLSPLNTVSRGYAIVKDSGGNIVTGVKCLSKGENIEVFMKDGELTCNITDIKESKNGQI